MKRLTADRIIIERDGEQFEFNVRKGEPLADELRRIASDIDDNDAYLDEQRRIKRNPPVLPRRKQPSKKR